MLVFAIKAIIVFFVIPQIYSSFPDFRRVSSFPDGYDRIAMNLIQGHGYRFFPETAPTLMRPPGYIGILAIIFSFFGKNLVAVQVMNLFFSMVTGVLLLILSKKILNLNRWNWLVVLFFLFYPGTILAEVRSGIESFFALLLTAFMLAFYIAIERQRARNYLLAGGLLGLALLVKNTPMLFPVFIFPYLIFSYRKQYSKKSIIAYFVLMILSMSAVYSPWIIRNYIISKQFVPFMTVKGVSAYQGLYLNKNFPSTKGQLKLIREAAKKQNVIAAEAGFKFKRSFSQYFYSSNDEIMFDSLLFNIVKKEYLADPMLLLKACSINFLRFWYSGDKSFILLSSILAIILQVILIFGTYLGYKNKLNITPIVIFIGAYILPHLPMLSMARYHVPLIPIISLFLLPILNTLKCSLNRSNLKLMSSTLGNKI